MDEKPVRSFDAGTPWSTCLDPRTPETPQKSDVPDLVIDSEQPNHYHCSGDETMPRVNFPSQALSGLNMAVNMATLTPEERDLFIRMAPTHLQDPQVLMDAVVSKDPTTAHLLGSSQQEPKLSPSLPNSDSGSETWTSSTVVTVGKQRESLPATPSPPLLPSTSLQFPVVNEIKMLNAIADRNFDFDTELSDLLEWSKPIGNCICPTVLTQQ